jgi:hypothetical protein
MARFIAWSQVQHQRFATGGAEGGVWQTFFLRPPPHSRDPQAFLVEYRPGRILAPHFHDVDEFQLFLAGSGSMGRHVVEPVTLHFARAFTAYGPITAGDGGLSFLTLRARRDALGPQKLPERRAELERQRERRPWQAHQQLPPRSGGQAMTPLSLFDGPNGLSAVVLDVGADAALCAPASAAGGQFLVAIEGSLVEEGSEREAPAVGFVPCSDAPQALRAGGAGARVLCLNFPHPVATDPA